LHLDAHLGGRQCRLRHVVAELELFKGVAVVVILLRAECRRVALRLVAEKGGAFVVDKRVPNAAHLQTRVGFRQAHVLTSRRKQGLTVRHDD
jgi:hypothetical protein